MQLRAMIVTTGFKSSSISVTLDKSVNIWATNVLSTYTHKYTHVYAHVYINTYTQTHTCIHVYTHTFLCVSLFTVFLPHHRPKCKLCEGRKFSSEAPAPSKVPGK